MKLVDRIARLETQSHAAGDRRRVVESDAADFVEEINRLAARHSGPSGTLGDFRSSIRRSGSAFLVATFIGEHHAHS